MNKHLTILALAGLLSVALSPATVIWSSTGAQNVDGPVTVTDTVTTQERSKRFVRVRISR